MIDFAILTMDVELSEELSALDLVTFKSCFVQLVGLRPHLVEQCPIAVLALDQFIGKIIRVHGDDTQSIAMQIEAAPRSSIITIATGDYRMEVPTTQIHGLEEWIHEQHRMYAGLRAKSSTPIRRKCRH